MSLSYTKYKAYAKYIVPTLLIIGATTAILGWYLIPTLQQIPPPANPYVSPRILVVATGIGVFCGGIVNFVVRRDEMANQKLTVKKVPAIIVLTVLASLLCYGFFFITVLIVSAVTKNLVLAFIVGLLPTLTIVVGLSISMLTKRSRKEAKT